MRKSFLIFACVVWCTTAVTKKTQTEIAAHHQIKQEQAVQPVQPKVSKTMTLDRLFLSYYQTRDDAGKQIEILLDLYRRFPTAGGQTLADLKKEFGTDAEKGIKDKIIALATQISAKK